MKSLERLKTLIAIGYPICVFIGFYSLSSFYSHFGIEIYNYIDLTEILFSFLNEITLLFVMLISLSMLGFVRLYMDFLLPPIELKPNKDDQKKVEIDDKKTGNKFFSILGKVFSFLGDKKEDIYLILNVVFVVVLSQKMFLEVGYVVLGMLYLLLALNVVRYLKKYFDLTKAGSNVLLSIILLSLVILFLKSRNESRYLQINSCQSELKHKVVLDHLEFTRDSTALYIGETKNYLFLYNCQDEQTTIISKSRSLNK